MKNFTKQIHSNFKKALAFITLGGGLLSAQVTTIPVVITSGFNQDIIANGGGSVESAPENSPACVFTPLSLTGFNADVFAEGTGADANGKVTETIDAANAFYTQDFVPLNPHSSGASAAAYGGGFPNDGFVESSATAGLTFQIAPYSGNNALVLRNNLTNTGTLTLVEQKKAEKIYLAWSSAEGANTVDITVNFADGSSQVFSNQTPIDWWSTSPNPDIVALGSVGRISAVTWAGWAPLNSFSGLTQTQLFQQEFLLDAANHDKLISSIGFVKQTTANNAITTTIFAISICETQDTATPVSVTIQTQNEVAAEINEAGGILQLEALVVPQEEDVVWTVESGNEFATVDQNGLVTAIADGVVVVRAALVSDTSIYDEIEITISNQVIAVISIEVITEGEVEPVINSLEQTLQLLAIISPEDATNTNVIWSVEEGESFVLVNEDGMVTAIANGTAVVRATAENSDVYGEIEVIVSLTMNIMEITEKHLSIFPNPAAEKITVKTDAPVKGIEVYNMNGQLVLQGIQNELNVQAIQAGSYIIQIRFEDDTVLTKKIIKN